MATASSIEWTDTTWNPVVGCKMVSPGCARCYAQTMSKRLAAMAKADRAAGKDPGRKAHYLDVMTHEGKFNGAVRFVPESLADPLTWKRPRNVFVNSMSDLFHEGLPFEYIATVFGVIDAAAVTEWGKPNARGHTFQILTKRPERAVDFLAWMDRRAAAVQPNGPRWTRQATDCNNFARERLGVEHGNALSLASGKWPLPNVLLGTSVEDDTRAAERLPRLWELKAAGWRTFVSYEPALGPVRWSRHAVFGCPPAPDHPTPKSTAFDWLIVGGESGPGARPFNVQWARDAVAFCRKAGVAPFVKQLGAWPYDPSWHGDGTPQGSRMRPNDKKGGDTAEWPEDLRVRELPAAV